MAILLRLLRLLGFLALALVVIYAIGRPTQKWLGGFYSGVREPYLQMMSSEAVTLRWQSAKEYSGVVHYGLKAEQLNYIQRENVAVEEHEIRLTRLKPATKYFYSAGDGKNTKYEGETFWFKTSPQIKIKDNNKSVRFWVTGDQGYPNVIQTQVRDAALNWVKQNPRTNKKDPAFDFWLTTGDNAYRSGSNEQFQAGFFQPYKTILRNTPVWPAYGNHDARRWAFFKIFSLPTAAESGGVVSGTEHYYSFDYANIHFVMLDTQEGDLDEDGDMLSWLKKDLELTQQQWLIAIMHHPPYSKGTHDSDNKWRSGGRLNETRENIIPLLEQAGTDLVLSGHSHMYERSGLINCHYGLSDSFSSGFIREESKQSIYHKKNDKLSAYNGTIYSVVGSSSKVDKGSLDHPAMPYSYHQAGSMVVDVNNNILKAYFVNNTGKVIDQFEIIKGVINGVDSQQCK